MNVPWLEAFLTYFPRVLGSLTGCILVVFLLVYLLRRFLAREYWVVHYFVFSHCGPSLLSISSEYRMFFPCATHYESNHVLYFRSRADAEQAANRIEQGCGFVKEAF